MHCWRIGVAIPQTSMPQSTSGPFFRSVCLHMFLYITDARCKGKSQVENVLYCKEFSTEHKEVIYTGSHTREDHVT